MTNPIATMPIAQPNKTGRHASAGLKSDQSDLASPEKTFVDFIMAHIDAMNISKDEISTIQKDLSDGQISQDSPLFNILGKMGEHLTLDGQNLSVGNQLFLSTLANLFVDLDTQGEINLPKDILTKLEKIGGGELPASEMVTLLEDSDLFAQLRTAIAQERVHGLAKTATKPEDIHEIVTEKVEELLLENAQDDATGIEIVLKRLENLLSDLQARLNGAKNAKNQQALENTIDHVSTLIAQFGEKLTTFNQEMSIDVETLEGFTPTRHALLKAIQSKNGIAQQNSSSPSSQAGLSVISGNIKGTTLKKNTNSFSLAPTSINGDSAWLNPADGEVGFDPQLDMRGMASDSIQNTIRSTKAATTQSARNLLPPSPAAQQVMVHIQKNANQQSRMNIQLNPAELGRVEVNLTVGKDGRATAVVMADRPETLNLLQKDSVHLERALQNAGLDVNHRDLSFNLRGDEQNDFNSRRRFSRHSKNNDLLSVDGNQLSAAQLDAAVFNQYSVNYKA